MTWFGEPSPEAGHRPQICEDDADNVTSPIGDDPCPLPPSIARVVRDSASLAAAWPDSPQRQR